MHQSATQTQTQAPGTNTVGETKRQPDLGVLRGADVVERGNEALAPAAGVDARALDELAHCQVVKVLDRRPLDTLVRVLLLLRLYRKNGKKMKMGEKPPAYPQRELDEDLLQLLVDKVDAKLLEATKKIG